MLSPDHSIPSSVRGRMEDGKPTLKTYTNFCEARSNDRHEYNMVVSH